MALTSDILATYRGPGRVMARFISQGRNEVRALIFLLLAGLLIFIASAPYQAREAQLDPEGPLAVRLYWSAFLWIFLMPLILYAFAAMIWALSKIARRQITGYEIRMTLFWSLLASTPVLLLLGIVAGFIGPSIQLQAVGIVWLCVFGWFWASGLLAAEGNV
ncbi:YIP1 family protein [Sulfitobacter sp. SK012]|uniref:YIP1 family protein n=1 Tax=Sulfitobacter sp. SK012 TaxID=1389005 RepID=UPI000E0C050F|nr:YIP1 family protein [Sulfitobacter sp. SK012]AXI46596.1 YIP1 family protein [Sulfitobacter sp. SK012]